MSSTGHGRTVAFAPTVQRAPARLKSPLPPLAELIKLRQALFHAALEPSTQAAYKRALQLWNTFAKAFAFPHFPTASNLSLFVAWRSTAVFATTIQGELSGLAYHFKALDEKRWSLERDTVEVARALRGAAKLKPHEIRRARPLPLPVLDKALAALFASPSLLYDDLLLAALLVVGFFTCARGQEITDYDAIKNRDARKHSLRSTVRLSSSGFAVALNYHKSDPLFTGSKMWFAASDAGDLLTVVKLYLAARDGLHGSAPHLWLKSDGTVPLRRWMVNGLKARCGQEYTGHSIRAGGATWYALRGVSESSIKRIGRWKSEAWLQYVRTDWEIAVALREAEAGGPPPARLTEFDDSALLPLLP